MLISKGIKSIPIFHQPSVSWPSAVAFASGWNIRVWRQKCEIQHLPNMEALATVPWQPGCNCSLALDNSSASSLKTFNSEAAASISWPKKRYTLAVHDQVHDHAHTPQIHISEIIREGAKRTYATFTLESCTFRFSYHNTLMHAMYTNLQQCMLRNMLKRSCDLMQFPLYILKSLHSLNGAKKQAHQTSMLIDVFYLGCRICRPSSTGSSTTSGTIHHLVLWAYPALTIRPAPSCCEDAALPWSHAEPDRAGVKRMVWAKSSSLSSSLRFGQNQSLCYSCASKLPAVRL